MLLELDRGGNLTATAHLPDQGISFPGALALVSPGAPASELATNLAELRAKTEALYTDPRIGEPGQKKLVLVDRRLEEMEGELAAAEGGDADALEKLRRMLVDADGTIADVEALRTWPELEARAGELISRAGSWIARTGTALEQQALEESIASLQRARATKNTRDFEQRLGAVERLIEAAVFRDPGAVGRCSAPPRAAPERRAIRAPRTSWFATGSARSRRETTKGCGGRWCRCGTCSPPRRPRGPRRTARGSSSERRAMTPRNAYYVLGLAADATPGDIEREGRKLLGLLELGVGKAATYTCALGTFRRDATLVRESMALLRDPARRARESALAAILGTDRPASSVAEHARRSAGPAAPLAEALRLAGYRGL